MPLTCLDDDVSACTPLLKGLQHQLHSNASHTSTVLPHTMSLTSLDDDISACTPLLKGLEHQLDSSLQPAWQ